MAARRGRKRAARRVGRPRAGEGAEDLRRRLVEVARGLFVRRGFGEVGIREIAREAGVTPGMISYYFGDKQGLYEAMFSSVFEELLARVRELASQAPGDDGPLAALIRVYVSTIGAQPWLPGLVLREVLTGDSALRDRFIGRFASRIAELLPALIRAEQAAGRVRADVDPTLAVLSLIGLCVFPFLGHPIAGKVFGYELDADFKERLVAHTQRLFFEGVRA
jgi:TetR/AcrR family transcriptional regulator